MGLFSDLFNRIFKRRKDKEIKFLESVTGDTKVEQLQVGEPKVEEIYEPIDLPEGELVSFSDEVLDTTSRVNEEKLKHNLEILLKQAKEKGKIDKFMLIREDDFFPEDWEWRVLSKDTNLEKESTMLSVELRKAYALEQSGKEPFVEIMGMKMPRSYDETMEALSKIDRNIGNVLLPSRFRSTKHFTVNTPLGVTGDYNSVSADRDYIIIDDMNAFLDSGYGYSVAYHDAYLDVSHESLPISENAVVLINDEKYERIMQDEKRAAELAQRKVIRFKGDESIAIDMVLTEMGVLPSQIGFRYANYDNEIRSILDSSIRELAEEHDIFFDMSHAGDVEAQKGHFSNYYDDKNKDYEKANQEFIGFLREKFSEHEELFPEYLRLTESTSQDIIQALGTTALLGAIDEYNELAKNKASESLEKYKEDRKNITPEVHDKFVSTIALINNFYKGDKKFEDYDDRLKTEESIQRFLQSSTIEEQLEAAESVWELLPNRAIQRENTAMEGETISMRDIVTNALRKRTATEHVMNCDKVEAQTKDTMQREGDTIDDK
ncbi:MAG: hypothetical protein K1W33_03895 [Clostridia bacterium]